MFNSFVNTINKYYYHANKYVFEKRCSDYKKNNFDLINANTISDTKLVDILNVNFYDWEGNILYKGGAERYVYDLACLLKKAGYEPRLVQNATRKFEKVYQGISVVGIPANSGWNFHVLYDYYLREFEHASFVICSPLDIAVYPSPLKVMGINHGIYWDSSKDSWVDSLVNINRSIFYSLENVFGCVCVDTNFMNWVRTFDTRLANKLRYIPNYYDPDAFKPTDKTFDDEEIVILYPRRLYKPRGFYLVIKMIDKLFAKHANLSVHFVGQANKQEEDVVNEYKKRYGSRVVWYELDMDSMHKAYETSQIVVVPTVSSEGTSLSCIEAMATNNAVISTNVGGLPNLIINLFNGLLVEPNEDDFIAAVESLVTSRSLRMQLAANATSVATSFEKSRWDESWSALINNHLQL